MKSLLVDDYLQLQVIEQKLVELSEEGASYAQKGTPEYQYTSGLEFNVSVNKAEYDKSVGVEFAKIGFSKAMQRKWVQLDADNKENVKRIAEHIEDSEKDQLLKFVEIPDLESHDKKIIDQLKKRKLVNVVSQKYYKVSKGENFQA